MKRIVGLIIYGLSLGVLAGEVSVKGITAQQRYPWNGLVDIVVTIQGNADDMNVVRCMFTSTNNATSKVVPVMSVTRVGADSIAGDICKRRYLWNAANDVGEVKIDDLALTVDAEPVAVQLWEDGPYWATCNVGASRPEEYGYYFCWGDTVGCKPNADNNGWISVKDGAEFSFDPAHCPTYDKSNSQLQSEGYIDSSGNLVAAHDAATAHLGADWRMPTDAEFSALRSNCDTLWTERNGVNGRLVVGKGAFASKNIFLPATGSGHYSSLNDMGSRGHYWSSTPDSGNSGGVWFLSLESDGFWRSYSSRFGGWSVRPLRMFANQGSVECSLSSMTTRLVLDCRTGVRVPSPDGEVLRYDASWRENCEEVRITDNGTVVTTGTAGVRTWRSETDASAPHLLKLEFLSGGQTIGTETALFGHGYIRNVTARQLWPHNKVALSFTVAEDIGEVKGGDKDLCVWCARGALTNVATRVLGDRSAKSGIHRIVWDLEADGLRFENAETTFGVSIDEVSMNGVQLWENGPYWAECNVGASKPEESGYYFWWGDTVGYQRNVNNDGWFSLKDGSSYSFSNCATFDKSNSQLQSLGYIDSTGNLVAAHDSATAYWGVPWRMPTDAEFAELINNCDTTWTTRNGVYGRLITGRGAYASNVIFLPAAGDGVDSIRYGTDLSGGYWSSTPYGNHQSSHGLSFGTGGFSRVIFGARYSGLSVRPLRECAK